MKNAPTVNVNEHNTINTLKIHRKKGVATNKLKKSFFRLISKSIIIIGLLIIFYFGFDKQNLKLNNVNSFSNLDVEESNELRNTTKNIYLDNQIKIKNLNSSNESDMSSNTVNIIFNQKMIEKYKYEQNYFCDNFSSFYNLNFENKIRLVDVEFKEQKYKMYVYAHSDVVSNSIIRSKSWERYETKRLLDALNFYSNKTNLKNGNITIVDIGANIGWYSILLGRKGYNILSFEPSELNNYILKKNYCFNKEANISIINKGLSTEEKKCDLYNLKENEGNGMILCGNETNNKPYFLHKNKTGEIILTKLSNYIPFLTKNNLALIKIDIEGSEGKAFEGGKELITEFHVPFIFLEFTPASLKLHGTEPKEFLEFFQKNGYHISTQSFFDTNYFYKESVLRDGIFNLYITYSKFID